MDPNKCREAIIWHAAQFRAARRNGFTADMTDAAGDLASAVDDLVTWQRGNGFAPTDGYPWEHSGPVAILAGQIIDAADNGNDRRMRGRAAELVKLISRV